MLNERVWERGGINSMYRFVMSLDTKCIDVFVSTT